MDFQSLVSLVWTNLILPSLFSNIEIIDKKGRNSVELRQNKGKGNYVYYVVASNNPVFVFGVNG